MNDNWSRLDNAARIFPAAQTKKDTQVFRFSCILKEDVDRDILQQTVVEVVDDFPLLKSILRRGVFWYYLEESDIVPEVKKEYKMPCSILYNKGKHSLLFEVTYFKKRINFEVFHVLCDGTGAMNFLKAIVTKYLSLAHRIPEPSLDYNATTGQMTDDSFLKYYSGKKSFIKAPKKRAYKLFGRQFIDSRLKVISGNLDVKKTIENAHKFNVTVTVFLAAIMIQSIGEEMSVRSKNRDVRLLIPINLRNYFSSETARNFFCLAYIGYNFSEGSGEFEDILKSLKEQLSSYSTREIMLDNINSYASAAENQFIRFVPLALKDVVLKQAYRINGNLCTGTFSNVGIVKMPEEIQEYIDYFEMYISTDRLQLCSCSYRNKLNLSFTSPFVNSDIERRFFKTLNSYGISAELHTNLEEIK